MNASRLEPPKTKEVMIPSASQSAVAQPNLKRTTGRCVVGGTRSNKIIIMSGVH